MTKALRRRSVYQQGTVAVELYLVEPVLAFGKVLDGERIHGFDKADFSGGRRLASVALTLGMLLLTRRARSSLVGYFKSLFIAAKC